MKYSAQLKAIEAETKDALAKAKAVRDSMQSDGRNTPTDEETEQINGHLKVVDTLKGKKLEIEDAIELDNKLEDLGKSFKAEEENKPAPVAIRSKSMGRQVVESKQWAAFRAGGFRGRSGAIDITGKAGEFLEGVGDGGDGVSDGLGGALVPIQYVPGVVNKVYQRLTIANLLAQGTTNSNALRYIIEKTATNAVAPVAEMAPKPQSLLELDFADVPVKKLATFLPVSSEMMEDGNAVSSYIDARLRLFVAQKVEDQLLNGAGGANISGLLDNLLGPNTGLKSAGNSMDDILAAITKVREAFLEPDGMVVHPTNWADMISSKTAVELEYLGNGPFGSPQQPTLWNIPVVITNAIAANTVLVGAFGTAAQVFYRNGVTVEASDSHADYFVDNMIALRAEQRLALCVYRAASFATADLS